MRLVTAECQGIILLGLSGQQRPVESRMTAKRGGQHVLAGVDDQKPNLEARPIEAVVHLQPEWEWIDRLRLGIVAQHQDASCRAALEPPKAAIARKAMLRHAVDLAA